MALSRKDKNLIDEGWYRLKRSIECHSGGQYPGQYLQQIREAERRHRRGYIGDRGHGCSVESAARYFALKYAVPFLTREPGNIYVPVVKDYLHVRHEVFHGMSLWLNFEDDIHKAFDGFDCEAFSKLDYVKMMEPRGEEVQS